MPREPYPTSSSLVAVIARSACVIFAMAFHTVFHCDGNLFPQRIAFRHRSVAAITFRARFEVDAVREPDPVGILVNPNPGHHLFVLMESG